MTPEERYYATSDEGVIRELRGERDALKGQIKHWQHLKEHYAREARTAQADLAEARERAARAEHTLGELRSEIMDAIEELPCASYGDTETNLGRWLDYINDDIAAALADRPEAAGDGGEDG